MKHKRILSKAIATMSSVAMLFTSVSLPISSPIVHADDDLPTQEQIAKLADVTDLQWVDGSSATVLWTAVADANYYSVTVKVYENDGTTLIGSTVTGTTATELDVQQEIHNVIGEADYDTVKVTATVVSQKKQDDVVVAQGDGVTTGLWEYQIVDRIKIPAATDLTLSDDCIATFKYEKSDAFYMYWINYKIEYNNRCTTGTLVGTALTDSNYNEESGTYTIDISQWLESTYFDTLHYADEEVTASFSVKFIATKTGYVDSDDSAYSNTITYCPKIPVSALTLAPRAPIVCKGHSYYLGKTIDPVDAYYEDIDWTSADESIVSVDENGMITGVDVGTKNVTAAIGKVSDTVPVTVYELQSNISDQEGLDEDDENEIIDTAGDIIDDIANNDDPDLSNTDIDEEDLEEIQQEIHTGMSLGYDFWINFKWQGRGYGHYREYWNMPEFWLWYDMQFGNHEGWHFGYGYSIEYEIGYTDNNNTDHHIANITDFGNNEYEFCFDVPKNLDKPGIGKKRQYKLVRYHDGQYEIIPVEVDDNGKMHGKSGKYSDFVLLYEDVDIAIDWDAPEYKWSKDDGKWTCTAKRVCKNDSTIFEEEIATVTSSVKTPATCMTDGTTTYTATFKNEAFTTQTQDVNDIPKTGHEWDKPLYVWSVKDNVWYCVARRICTHDNSHYDYKQGTVTSEVTTPATCTTNGITTYTATFDDPDIKPATKNVSDVPATGHSYGSPEWSWADDFITATAKFTCSKGDDTRTVKATVTSVTTEPTYTTSGKIVYTATAGFNDKTYTDTKTVIIASLSLTHVKAVEPTCTTDGNIEFWFDKTNNKYYTDPEAKNEITQADTVIEKIGHSYGLSKWTWRADYSAYAIFTCTNCNDEKTVEATVTYKTTEPTYTSAGKTAYTAYVKFNGKSYSYEKTVTIPKIGLTHVEAVEPTCTEAGNIEYWFDEANNKYFTDADGENEITQAKTVVKAKGHSYGAPEWTWSDDNSATATFKCANCDDEQTVNAVMTAEVTAPTYTQFGKTVYTAIVKFEGKTYTATRTVKIEKKAYTAPKVSYLKGDNAVKLTWTAMEGAERYGIAGLIDGNWKLLNRTKDTSFIIDNLNPGEQYKVAVVAMFDGEYIMDFSNAIVVTPKLAQEVVYPKITDIEYNVQYHQFKLNWSAVPGAQNYGVAVYLAGKWKIQTQTIPATTTSFTSPKLKAGQTYKMIVCAKVNGKWDLSALNSRAFEVTVK